MSEQDRAQEAQTAAIDAMARRTDDILTVAMFIGWPEHADMYGARKAKETFDAFCRIAGVDSSRLYAIIRGEE